MKGVKGYLWEIWRTIFRIAINSGTIFRAYLKGFLFCFWNASIRKRSWMGIVLKTNQLSAGRTWEINWSFQVRKLFLSTQNLLFGFNGERFITPRWNENLALPIIREQTYSIFTVFHSLPFNWLRYGECEGGFAVWKAESVETVAAGGVEGQLILYCELLKKPVWNTQIELHNKEKPLGGFFLAPCILRGWLRRFIFALIRIQRFSSGENTPSYLCTL